MRVRFARRFTRKFTKLPRPLQHDVTAAMERFTANPLDPTLHNHALHGRMHGLRAFSAGGDLRIIFQEYRGYVLVVVLDIGTHERVYR